MKKILSLLVFVLFTGLVGAQVSKTINVATAGTLSSLLTTEEKATVTDFVITGNIDARDVKCMRDEMTMLAVLDMSGVSIDAYSGVYNSGTSFYTSSYPANEMPQYSFYNANSSGGKMTLKQIKFPFSITSIGSNAFTYCGLIDNLIIPNSVSVIGESAFAGCGNNSINIPDAITIIGDYAFLNCRGIGNLKLPSSIISIGKGAFWESNLTSVTFPNTTFKLGERAFYGCSELLEFSVASDNPNYSVIDGVLFNKDQTSLLLYPSGKKGAYVIPNSVNNLEKNSFIGCNGLTSIEMPNTLTTIKDSTFYNCINMTNAFIPNSITYIGSSAFYNCYKLSNINIPNTLSTIEDNTFAYCSGLTSIIIPNSISFIGNEAFSNCTGLSVIYSLNIIPPTLGNRQGNGCFYNAYASNVYVPASALDLYNRNWWGFNYQAIQAVPTRTIDVNVAGSLSSLLTFEEKITTTNLILTGNIDFRDFKCLHDEFTSLEVLDISTVSIKAFDATVALGFNSAVNEIPANTFANCTLLNSITLPITLQSIGNKAFSGCYRLIIIYSSNNTPPVLGKDCFENTLLSSIYVSSSVVDIYKQAQGWNIYSSIIGTIYSKKIFVSSPGWLSSMLRIDEKSRITDLTVTGVIDARDIICMRDELVNLATLDISAVNILEYTDTYYSKLYPANEMPENSFSWYEPTFYKYVGKTTLQLVRMPKSIVSIGSLAFSGCTSLNTLTIPTSVTTIGNSAFESCSGIKGSLSIPNSVTKIGNWAFAMCSGFTGNLQIPSNLTTIESFVFGGCSGFSGKLIIPSTVTSIGDRAFAGCSGLSGNLDIPESVKSYGDGAFYSCTGLTSVNIPNSITTLTRMGFVGCNFTSISIPSSITSIEWDPFGGGPLLQSVYSYGTVPMDLTPYGYIFGAVYDTNCTLYVPSGSKTAYQEAEIWKSFKNIVEMTVTKNNNIARSKLRIYTTQSEIIIEGTSKGETITLYTLNGRKLLTIKSQGEKITIPVPTDAVYLVKTAGKTFKVRL